jgi:hypothetical protein
MNPLSSPASSSRFFRRPAVRLLFQVSALAIATALGFLGAGDPALGQVVASTLRPAREWERFPAIAEVDTTADIFALGDVHGDYDRLINLLVAGQIISGTPAAPERVEWAAGKSVLVCTGDLIDKGHDSIKVILLFKALQTGAASAGGRVIVTMGNHEAVFLAGPATDPKAVDFLEELNKKQIDPQQVADGLDPLGLGAFLRSLPFAARVNDWFFAHAGNTHGKTLMDLASYLRGGVDAKGYQAEALLADDSLLEARLHPHPWWEEEDEKPAESRARLLRAVLALEVKHLVIGHQPGKVEFSGGLKRKKGEMYQNFDGLIFLIDVGMSSAPDLNYSQGALLRIHNGKSPEAVALYPDGTSERLWPGP